MEAVTVRERLGLFQPCPSPENGPLASRNFALTTDRLLTRAAR